MNRKCVWLVWTLLFASGCLRTTVNIDDRVVAPASKHQRFHFFVFGLAPGEQTVKASELCGQGHLVKIESSTSFLDGFLGAVTLGIYYPKTLHVWCQA